MKTFLMFQDRDFNPKGPFPPNTDDLIRDLELNTLLKAMSLGDDFLFDVSKTALLSSLKEINAIQYRQEILQDCLNHPAVIRALYQIPIDVTERKRHSWLGIFTHSPSSVLSGAVEMMSVYILYLRKLQRIAAENAQVFRSAGFMRFFAMLQQELTDEFFAMAQYHLKQLKFQNGVLISVELGKGNEGKQYVLRLPSAKNKNWLKEVFSNKKVAYSFTLSERDDAGARALSELTDRGVNNAADALAQAADHIEAFFSVLRNELAFYVGCINLKEQLETINCPMTFPLPTDMPEPLHAFRDLCDISLALTTRQAVTGNEIDAGSKTLVIVTGANQGGKSTFLRSIGTAQLMMQAGMFVAAREFRANLCAGVFTHYRRKEDAAMKSGKLDEELSRMSTIVDQISPNCLILFNESFAATNEREGSEIARQITSALLDRNIKIFFVTHMYEFARIFYEKRLKETLFLRAERRSGGRRTFKLILGEPLPTSYGADVYKQIFKESEGNSAGPA